jgi:acyl-CoA synthetase (AMP-forming)/AMP-acid ligase II/acetyltransferase-like isoleucine patch superfamily enzyme/acyl carrier protein
VFLETNAVRKDEGRLSIYELLKERAEKAVDAIAIAAPGRIPLTYGRLLEHVEATAEALRGFGLGRKDRIAMVLPNGPEMAAAFVAVAAASTCAPLNPSYRVDEFDFYLSDLNAKGLIVWAGMGSPARRVARKRNIPIVELTPLLEAEAGIFELKGKKVVASADTSFGEARDIALVLHTSGTTVRPKIVPLTQTNICSSGRNICSTLALTESDRCLNIMPLFHIHGLIGAVLSSLTAGASVVCTSGLDTGRFCEWLHKFQPSWYTAVPTMHQAILARAGANGRTIERCHMRFIRSSSASLPPRIMAALEDWFETPVIESYGMTEAAHQMTSNPLAPSPRKAGSVGIPAGPDVAIMDESGSLLPVGEIGEVVIRGTNVMGGYENNFAANQKAFIDGWFRTGDQGRFDPDGYLFLTGRLKEIINRAGEKVAPQEIDAVLMRHPAVSEAIAFAVPHATLGEDVAAAVVLTGDATVSESDIRDFAARHLVDFKIPSQVLIVDEIPKGPTGKLQRNSLAEKLAKKRPNGFIAPRTSVEKQVTEIWRRLLKARDLDRRDNFYAIGGDSLTLAEMMIEVEERFKTKVPLRSFLRSPTIETLAGFLEGCETSNGFGPAVPEGTSAPGPIRDRLMVGVKNRVLQILALYVPGYKTTRVWLHRMRGVAIGNNVSIGLSVLIESAHPRLVWIGENVTIGMRVIIIGHLRDLTTEARASNRPTVRISDNVYIGPGVVILPNVTIGAGAVVSAGSVVSSSIPPATLARGNPAKPIAHCGVSLGGGVSYEEFLRHLTPIKERHES